jgi:hypothetical protein
MMFDSGLPRIFQGDQRRGSPIFKHLGLDWVGFRVEEIKAKVGFRVYPQDLRISYLSGGLPRIETWASA